MLFYASIIELADLLSDSESQPEVTLFDYDVMMPDPSNPRWQGLFDKTQTMMTFIANSEGI